MNQNSSVKAVLQGQARERERPDRSHITEVSFTIYTATRKKKEMEKHIINDILEKEGLCSHTANTNN